MSAFGESCKVGGSQSTASSTGPVYTSYRQCCPLCQRHSLVGLNILTPSSIPPLYSRSPPPPNHNILSWEQRRRGGGRGYTCHQPPASSGYCQSQGRAPLSPYFRLLHQIRQLVTPVNSLHPSSRCTCQLAVPVNSLHPSTHYTRQLAVLTAVYHSLIPDCNSTELNITSSTILCSPTANPCLYMACSCANKLLLYLWQCLRKLIINQQMHFCNGGRAIIYFLCLTLMLMIRNICVPACVGAT